MAWRLALPASVVRKVCSKLSAPASLEGQTDGAHVHFTLRLKQTLYGQTANQ